MAVEKLRFSLKVNQKAVKKNKNLINLVGTKKVQCNLKFFYLYARCVENRFLLLIVLK